MGKLLVLVCGLAAALGHAPENRVISIDELASAFPVVSSNVPHHKSNLAYSDWTLASRVGPTEQETPVNVLPVLEEKFQEAPQEVTREHHHHFQEKPLESARERFEPKFLQEALYESPLESYPFPRHSGYPLRDNYPWPQSAPAYKELYRSAPEADLSRFHQDLFYTPALRSTPLPGVSPPFDKPFIVDEITKPLIVEHFQAPVVVDCYQKPIVISHFIPPIINDFYEAPDFVEKTVELELEPCPDLATPAPCS